MAFILSTGARDAMAGKPDSYSANTIQADETGGVYTLIDSESGFLSAGFRPGDLIQISGFADVTANNQYTIVTSVTNNGGTMTIPGVLADDNSDTNDTVTITTVVGKSFRDMFRNHVIKVYSGAAPATADLTETGTLLVTLTDSSATVTAGTATNGLNFNEPSSGVLAKLTGDVISGVAVASGTGGYYRIYDNGITIGASTTAKRAQGTLGTASAQFILSSLTITLGATTTASTHAITLPAT